MNTLPNWAEMSKEARVEAVKSFAAEGLSAGQIASRFRNASRNAIMGYITRHDISLANQRMITRLREKVEARPHPGNIARKAASRKHDPGIKAKTAPIPAVIPVEDVAFVPRALAFNPLPDVIPVNLVDLVKWQCRWPVNGIDGSEPIFCGAHASTIYCNSHARMAYTPR